MQHRVACGSRRSLHKLKPSPTYAGGHARAVDGYSRSNVADAGRDPSRDSAATSPPPPQGGESGRRRTSAPSGVTTTTHIHGRLTMCTPPSLRRVPVAVATAATAGTAAAASGNREAPARTRQPTGLKPHGSPPIPAATPRPEPPGVDRRVEHGRPTWPLSPPPSASEPRGHRGPRGEPRRREPTATRPNKAATSISTVLASTTAVATSIVGCQKGRVCETSVRGSDVL